MYTFRNPLFHLLGPRHLRRRRRHGRRQGPAVLEWPVPMTVRALRGFLGLVGYYRDYGLIAAPLSPDHPVAKGEWFR
jgi:hypothetical protein